MALVLRRSYLKAKDHLILTVSSNSSSEHFPWIFTCINRTLSDDKSHTPEFSNSTILVENGLNVQELPVVIRRIKNITDADSVFLTQSEKNTPDTVSYHLIQAEFQQCVDLRDVFTLLSKCTKITPNIALGAMERIYELEKQPNTFMNVKDNNAHLAKGAILDKLLKVVMKSEDTHTILNVIKSVSSIMEPFKHKFCDELLFRTIDNKLTIEQICDFAQFLVDNKSDTKYADTIDKLWVGFVERESGINEKNIVMVFNLLPNLKVSKRIVLSLLEQKLCDLWSKIKVPAMQGILSSFVEEKYISFQSFSIVGRWLNTNIHVLDEDALLDIVSKITRLKYTDDQIEKAVEKYMKLKGKKIQSQVLIVGVLNYCMQFQIHNAQIFNSCSEYFIKHARNITPSFLKSYVYPFGYLSFDPDNSCKFWEEAENASFYHFNKLNIEDLCSIVLSHIYLGKYPLKLVNRVFNSELLVRVNKPETLKNLHLIDTALSIECKDYKGPLLPKDQWPKPMPPDSRIKNIVNKIHDCLISVAGAANKMSLNVMVPHFSDKTYLIDVMLHPVGCGDTVYNWKTKSSRNTNTAILIHLPDHYCSDNKELIGPQMMRKKHLRILGLKVVSVKYSVISQYYSSYNMKGLKQYLLYSINNAENCA